MQIVSNEQRCRFRCGERFVRSWRPPNDPLGDRKATTVLGLVHGLGDHSGRYDEMARWFAGRGIHVYAFDLLGHGNSPGGRMLIPDYEALLNDVESFFEYIQLRHVDSRLGLFGQSMGGNLVLNHQLRGYSTSSFVIAGSPMLRAPRQPRGVSLAVLRALSYLRPNFKLKGNVDPLNLSRDPEAVRTFHDDPLVQRGITLKLGRVLIDSGSWALEVADRLPTQTLLTHGSDDQITCHQASLEFAERSLGKATTKIWSGGKHDLHHDIIRNDYFETVHRWIESISPAEP